MSDFDGLYRAIVASPHEDTPRLVMADYLDDVATSVPCNNCRGTGCPGPKWGLNDRLEYEPLRIPVCPKCRGSGAVPDFAGRLSRFIRVQYAIANFPHDDDAAALAPLIQQERELWGAWPETDDLRTWSHGLRPECWQGDWPILPYSHRSSGTQLLARHGFVDVVCGGSSFLLGGECYWCEGQGTERVADAAGDMDDIQCRKCRGTRIMRGALPELVKAFPIREVQLLDFEPLKWSPDPGESSFDGPDYWSVGCLSRTREPRRSVPDHIWHRLSGRAAGAWARWLRYDSEAEARADVSRAALDWAAAGGRE